MPKFPDHPERRVAVVTGASSGIGAATVDVLAEHGHPVILGARRLDRLEAHAERIRAAGGEAVALPLDLTDPSSIDAFADKAATALGPIDIVVSNAGVVDPITGVGGDPTRFARSIQLNLVGAQQLIALLGPQLVEQGHGDIVFVTSDVVVRPRTHMAGYVAAKAGLEGLCRAIQMELEGTGVRAGMVRPGPSSTEQGTDWSEETILHVMPHWERWGLLRHNGALLPRNLAEAILAMVSAPKGCQLTLVEVEPEAPIQENRSTS
ncbi:MAG: SDR family oxidoreductase [Acidimicrobiales bacterium]|nr:SDR family oxidoreductase [Acidimicrobiales bacterium]